MQLHRCHGKGMILHDKCGGQLSIEGTGTVSLGTGFGFDAASRGKFAIDRIKYQCYRGWCMKCNVSGDFIRTDVPGVPERIFPDKINNKVLASKLIVKKASKLKPIKFN